MAFKRLEDVLLEESPGPTASFGVVHVLKAIYLLGAGGSVGRKKLAVGLGLGEGAARTLISRLIRAGLIETSRAGCALTSRGKRVYRRLTKKASKPTEVRLENVDFGPEVCVMTVQGGASRIQSGLEQRDAAVRAGATGVMTFVVKSGQIVMPSISNVDRDHPAFAKELRQIIELRENDAILVASADKGIAAEYGVLAAAWTLLNGKAQK